MSLFNIKLSFIGQWKIRIYKRSHVETGNTPHNPAEKKSQEIECTHATKNHQFVDRLDFNKA